jgi:o-succinylbenzoate---CoA ligase
MTAYRHTTMPAAAARRLVALALPPGEAFIDALTAAWRRGDAVMPLDPAAPAAVVERLLTAMRLADPVEDGVALVIPTSGSTGEPKGVQLSHAALEASARATHARIGLATDDRWLSCLPWQHIGGIQVMLRSRLLDIPLSVHDRFEIDRVAASEATLVSLVPTQLGRLLDAGVDLSRFRVILLGGAAAPAGLLERATAAGARVVTTYGMSETAGGCVYDGVPLDGVRVRLDLDGRVCIRGAVLMSGYRGASEQRDVVLDDGWLLTSDLGEIGPDGLLRVTGRADDVVITGGEKIVSSQVAAVLSAHPGLAEVVVVGVDDAEWGQRLVAVVTVRSGHLAPSLVDLRDWCSDRLAPAARPRGLAVVDDIPRLVSGKPDRRAVSRLAAWRSGDDGV